MFRRNLFELIHPKDAGGDGFSRGDGFTHILFGRTDEGGEDLTDIETEERHLPEGADGFSRQRFTAARETEEEDTFREGTTEFTGFRAEGEVTGFEPCLEDFEATDVTKFEVGLIEFEEAVLTDEVFLFIGDRFDIEIALNDEGF